MPHVSAELGSTGGWSIPIYVMNFSTDIRALLGEGNFVKTHSSKVKKLFDKVRNATKENIPIQSK